VTFPAGSREDVEAAVAAAVAAYKRGNWSKTTGTQRAVVLRAIAQKVRTAVAGKLVDVCASAHYSSNWAAGLIAVALTSSILR
jgi:acyl-CoA reductase-like NAD-dependent aldehyde dehydrogenase